jgi:hypothetical protein
VASSSSTHENSLCHVYHHGDRTAVLQGGADGGNLHLLEWSFLAQINLAMTENKQELWRLRAAVIGWLRYDRRCPLVCFERSPFQEANYRPDVIGVNRTWRVIEVEIKQSISDFKHNGEKRGHKLRYQFPVQFYFAVPYRLMKQAKPLLTDGQGLLVLRKDDDAKFGPVVHAVVGATVNKAATRLCKYGAMRMVMHQTGSLQRAVLALSRLET